MKLGLDIGALFVKAVVTNEKNEYIKHISLAHKGEIFKVTHEVVKELSLDVLPKKLEVVGVNAGLIADALGLKEGNEVAAIIRSVRQIHPDARQIIDIGGGSLSLIEIGEDGTFSGYQTNTVCAAGTGSFLDEQAARLGLDYDQLAKMPEIEHPPSVAARCAVFAKSDLIHRQQEGYGKPEMWSGLCRGLVRTILMTLFKGRKPSGKTVIVGGVARNGEVMRWLAEALPEEMAVMQQAQEAAAWGAAMNAVELEKEPLLDGLLGASSNESLSDLRPPLELVRSSYPSFDVEEFYIDEDENEIRVTAWPENGIARGYLGIDIGSTSTKLLLLDDNEEVILDIYRKTGGDPIAATQSLFRAMRKLAENRKGRVEVLGVGTTGSGRKLVGAVLKADRVINEITAHVTGAMSIDPTIDTIFEIGGQDAKYIHTVNGHLHNANMNYVCAAGTGSFVEELSRKMGFDLFTLGDEVLGEKPPFTSDRCTVFMDQDARTLLRKGYSPREVMGAVMYSVVQNYLNKVVGNRYYSKEKVFFQGATARNKGLVAAFENLLNVEVVVSPYCHVMGCWGVALLTRRQMLENAENTSFVGLEMADKKVALSQQECKMCSNRCSITYAEVDGLSERPSWGYLCGRDPEDKHVKINKNFDLFRLRQKFWKTTGSDIELPENAPVIGMPRALLSYTYYPMWRRFFAELGYRLELSEQTNYTISDLASDWVGADYCHPVKLAHGHLRWMLEKKTYDRVFTPFMISAPDTGGKTSEAFFCPYNIALPAMFTAAMKLNGIDTERLLTATMDLRWNDKTAAERLHEDLGALLSRSKRQIAAAWKKARSVHGEFEDAIKTEGRERFEEVLSSGEPAIVILGRPYNVFDPGANLALPEKIARMGLPVVPLEFLPLDEENLGDEFHNMFWNFGRKIMEAARYIARTPNLYAVYFSNFSCGPDSFIETYAEEIMGEKPMLMLELDEHGADAGYLTRLEAFTDVLSVNDAQTSPRFTFKKPPIDSEGLAGRTLWVPPMGEGSPSLVAASLRAAGIDSKPLPLEDASAFAMGKDSTRGGECVPCPATLGTFFATVEREGGDTSKHALFMPTASGPCRFGQYCTLDRIAMNRKGWNDVPVVSWTSEDSYDGTDDETRRWMWRGIVLGDVLFKMRCRVLPYEKVAGTTEKAFTYWLARFVEVFEKREDLAAIVRDAKQAFMDIDTHDEVKPLVGIVGEIYVRNNAFTNQDVVRRIERAGGEAWLAPISEWILYTAYMESWTKGYRSGGLMERMGKFLKNRYLAKDEQYWTDFVSPVLDDRHEPSIANTIEKGARFVPMDFEGETIITLGRTIEFMEGGASLVVNCAPFGCMPGSVTSGIFQQIQREQGVPVANMFYDGEGSINEVIDTYIANIRNFGRADAPVQDVNMKRVEAGAGK